MSRESSDKHRVINHTSNPVELHLVSQVLVVPPYGEVELGGEDHAVPQVQTLCQFGLLSSWPVEDSEADAQGSDAGSSAKTTAKPATSGRTRKARSKPRAKTGKRQ